MKMPLRTLAATAAAACLCSAAAALAQQPAGKNPQRVYYDSYEASHRQRLRRDTCMRDEDMIQQYCVKKCEKGYINVSGTAVPRVCRGEKPLPPGQLPQPYHRQSGIQPVPPKRTAPVPGA